MTTKRRIFAFIDMANINLAFASLKKSSALSDEIRLDCPRLVEIVSLGEIISSKSVYVGLSQMAGENNQHKFISHLKLNGFDVVTKELKSILTGDGTRKNKANFDVEIAVDICSQIWEKQCDEIMLFSGDSDFAYIIKKAKDQNIKITVVSSQTTLSRELRELSDRLVLLEELPIEAYTFCK